MNDLSYENHHRVAVARELTAMEGCPLRDRYGFAASDKTVLFIVNAVFTEPDDHKCGDIIGVANATDPDIQFAEAYDTPASEEYEQAIIAALRPLVAMRRHAHGRAQIEGAHRNWTGRTP